MAEQSAVAKLAKDRGICLRRVHEQATRVGRGCIATEEYLLRDLDLIRGYCEEQHTLLESGARRRAPDPCKGVFEEINRLSRSAETKPNEMVAALKRITAVSGDALGHARVHSLEELAGPTLEGQRARGDFDEMAAEYGFHPDSVIGRVFKLAPEHAKVFNGDGQYAVIKMLIERVNELADREARRQRFGG